MRRLIQLLLFVPVFAYGQGPTYRQADSISYARFLARDFNGVKTIVQEALENGIDFYYLRMRAGITGYEKHRYEYAIPHFEKAHEMFPSDTVALEYLYFSYLFAGREERAWELAARSGERFREKVRYREKQLEQISVSGGALLTDNISGHENDPFAKSDALYSERRLNGNVYSGSFFISGRTGIRTKLHAGLSFFNTRSLGILEHNDMRARQSFSNTHFQANLAVSRTTKNDWRFTAGLGGYSVSESRLALVFNDQATQPPRLLATTETVLAGALLLSASRRLRFAEPVFSVSVSGLSGLRQLQAEGGLTWYPSGNMRFYTYSAVAVLNNGNRLQWVLTQKLGARFSPSVSAETSLLAGNLENYIAASGFSTYNTFDPVRLNTGLDIRVKTARVTVVPGYRLQLRESSIRHFTSPQNSLTVSSGQYINHLLNISLQWRF